MEITVIRHTRVAVEPGICYGQMDVPPADTFVAEMNSLKEALGPDLPESVRCSPLTRCTRLAEALAPGRWQADHRLLELSFGNWEGKRWQTIPRHESDPWMNNFVTLAPPGGESLQALYRRVTGFLESLPAAEDKPVLIITHAGVIRCLRSYFLNIPLRHLFTIPVGHGEVFRATLGPRPEFKRIYTSRHQIFRFSFVASPLAAALETPARASADAT